MKKIIKYTRQNHVICTIYAIKSKKIIWKKLLNFWICHPKMDVMEIYIEPKNETVS